MTHTDLSFSFAYTFIFASCAIGFIFGMVNWFFIKDIDIKTEESTDIEENLLEEKEKMNKCYELMIKTTKLIQDGAMTFLMAEYAFLGVFIAIFSIIILLTDKFRIFTVLAFILGAITSTVSGFIGMYVATRTNAKVTFKASQKDSATALKDAFRVGLRGGCVMGFCLVSLALAVLTVLIMGYLYYLKPTNTKEFTSLFEFVAGYGLGGSTVALFCRVGGGIYTKAADVGADLVGKVIMNLKEDSPENPATIADNVGDNVGDIAGMGSDLFGSFAESTCAALVVSGTSVELIREANFMFPLILTAAGIIACLITAIIGINVMVVDKPEKIEPTLTYQLVISTVFFNSFLFRKL